MRKAGRNQEFNFEIIFNYFIFFQKRYLFSIAVNYLSVFVIALIVGQVGNVITNRNASRAEFERLLVNLKLIYFKLYLLLTLCVLTK